MSQQMQQDNVNIQEGQDVQIQIPVVEQVIVETLPLDKKLEILKKLNWFDQYEPGKYVDAMDTVNQWCLGEIVAVDQRTLNIHFDGWSSKWDCYYKMNSFKVNPFRRYSRGYTGQSKIALRKLHFTLEDLAKEKLFLVTLMENDLNGLGAFETTQYFRGKLYIYLDFLLGTPTYTDENLDAVIDFLYTVLRMIVQWLKKLPKLSPLYAQLRVNPDLFMIDENIALIQCYNEFFDILKKLFCCCPRSLRFYILFDKNYINYDKAITNNYENILFEKQRKSEEDYDFDEAKDIITSRKNIVYGQFVNFVNYFAEIGGFDALLDLLRVGMNSDDEKIPLEMVSLLTSPFKNCNSIFSSTFTEQFVTSIKDIVFERIRGMTEKEIKEIDKELVSKVLTDLKDFLNLHYTEQATSELVESNQLFMAHRFLKSTYLEKRLKGLAHIKYMIDKIEAGQRIQQRNNLVMSNSRMGQDQEMSGGGSNLFNAGEKLKPPKWLTAEYLKEWLINQKVLETVLGENTHLEIVKRSGCILKFLSKLDALPIETVDLIWKCQLGKHEEMVRVIYNIIKELVPFIQQEFIDKFYEKIQTVPPKQYDEKFLLFLKDFTMKALENYYEYKNNEISISENQPFDFNESCDQREALILSQFKEHLNSPTKGLTGSEKLYGLPIFWDLLQDKSANYVSNEMKENAIASITEILKQNYCKHIRISFVIRCVENLLKSESIVQSIIISQTIISEYPEMVYSPNVTTYIDFIVELQKQVKIVEVLIQNITNYYTIVKDKLKLQTSLKKSTDDIFNHVFVGRHTHEQTLSKLLEFFEFLIIQSNLKVSFGIENIETLWRLFVQQPNCNQDQTLFLKWINKQREVQYREERFLFTDEEKKFFFTKILCNPTYIDFRNISIGQVKCFQKYFKVINKHEENITLNRKTMRVVDFSKLIGLDTLWQISLECQNEKVKESSIDLLVDLHLKFEIQTISLEQQKLIWEEFIDKCMKFIESGDTTTIQNAILLISKFLDRYDGKKTLKPDMKVSPHFTTIQPLNIMVFNKNDQSRKTVTITYFQTLGLLRQKIAEAFEYQISEFIMSIKQNFIDPDDDDDKYIKDVGQIQQVLIQKNNAYIPENHPKFIISTNQSYFEKLFSILSSDQNALIEPTWDLLSKLPTNQRLQDELRNLESVQLNPDNWNQLLDPKSTYKLLYSLKILSGLNGNKKDSRTLSWRNNFLKMKGLNHLLNTFINLDIKRIETTLTLKCIDYLIQLLFEFVNIDKNIINEIINKKETLISKCIYLIDLISDFSIKIEKERGESLEDISKRVQQSKMIKNKYKAYMAGNKGGDKKASGGNNSQSKQGNEEEDDNDNQDSHQLQVLYKQFGEENQLIQVIFRFLYSCVIHNEPASIVHLPQYPNIEETLFKSMLRTENFAMRQEMAKKIKEMVSSKSQKPEMKYLIKIVEILLFNIQKHTKEFDARSLQFYDGLASLLELLHPEDLALLKSDVKDLVFTLANEIKDRDIKEKSSQNTDSLLVGKMKLLKALLQKLPHLKAPIGDILVPYLLHEGLFEIPNGGQSKSKLSASSPKCKAFVTRQNCVRLIAVLCRDCVPNLTIVLNYLAKFNENPSWRTNKEHDWNIALRESEKSSTGYVGIKNLGCICYMNSLFQQLFMIPSLRNDILNVKNNNPNNEEKEENMLYQLQLLFTGLLKSEKQYVNPKGFCHAFKDWEGNATNVLEQMDVEEFFNMFMDRLETAIKGNPQEKTVQYHFGGKYTHEMICKGCPHTYERQEPFLALSVQVKNKKSILEGLDTFILGDMLEGENAYLCEKCDKKVDTLKRTSIKKLPRYLIIALKRFEFDFDRMVRVKVNDYLEFPVELNMEPYTQEGLARKEKAQKTQENSESHEDSSQQEQKDELKYPQDYYMYNLSGVVIHTGTADSGHYYSFIKDKDNQEGGKWYEMNDSIVREFDANDIPSECYGGEDTFQGYNMTQMKSMKWRNAYLLFYERKIFDDVVGDEDEEESKKVNTSDIVMQNAQLELSDIDQKIAYENQKYWQNRFLFGNEYHEFVYDIALNWNTSTLIPKTHLTKNDDFHITGEIMPLEYTNDNTLSDPIDITMDLKKQISEQDIEALEHQVFKLAVGFYVGILQRGANKGFLPQTLNLLKAYINKSPTNAFWLLEEFCNEQLIEENLLQNSQKEMRKFITGLLYCSMLKIYPLEKDKLNMYWKEPTNQQGFSVLGNLMVILIKNLYELKKFTSNNMQYFQLIARFSSLGAEAREFLLRARMVGRLMDFFFDGASPYKDEFRNMNDLIPQIKSKPDIGLPTQIDKKQMSYFQEVMERRRLKTMMEATPKYKYLIEIISNCIRSCKMGPTRTPYQLDDFVHKIESNERDIFIPEAKFLKRIFSQALRNRSVNMICKTYCHYTWFENQSFEELIKTIITGLNEFDYDDIRPYLMLTQYMVARPTDHSNQNALDLVLSSFLEGVRNNCTYYRFMETIFDFIFKITARYEHVRQWFFAKKGQWEWMVDWIKEYKQPPNPIAQNSSMRLLKKRGNMNMMQMQGGFKGDQLKASIMYAYRVRRLEMLLSGTGPDTSQEIDLDLLDLQDHKFVIGEFIDIYHKKQERLNSYVIESVLDEMINIKQIQNINDGQSCFNWQACDTDKLMFRGALSSQIKNKMIEAFTNQLDKNRQGGNGGQYDSNMQQSDEENEESDDSDTNKANNNM